ncbi:hypothetical protein ACFQVA_03610 [Actinomadura keratinilytica]
MAELPCTHPRRPRPRPAAAARPHRARHRCRRSGIGHAVARRLAAYGASVHLHHHVPHDAAQPWGADDPADVAASVREALAAPGARVTHGPADLAAPKSRPSSSPTPWKPSAGGSTSLSPTTPAAVTTARSTRSTPAPSTPTGRSTPAR